MSSARIFKNLRHPASVRSIYSGSGAAEVLHWEEMHYYFSRSPSGSACTVSQHTSVEIYKHGRMFNKPIDKTVHVESFASACMPNDHVHDAGIAYHDKNNSFKAW